MSTQDPKTHPLYEEWMDDILECMEALGHDLYEMVDILHKNGPEPAKYDADRIVREIVEKNKRLLEEGKK